MHQNRESLVIVIYSSQSDTTGTIDFFEGQVGEKAETDLVKKKKGKKRKQENIAASKFVVYFCV